ncbi:GFA family protein [Defluviimonas sp. WL0024]|uniref:GFA family protein n=1 Tax=Albidovulum salinarum TaxID=2984153 RepID=A0ABT2X3B5_9RHOB|nr:GFA family protein [Defluviimonas sp. WL0024]MCU9848423.1 GFA family protein [Defluviimonas sp. WL0024]
MTSTPPFAGGCLCGAIRYEISAPPYDPHYCHCRSCQKAAGAPAIAGAFIARTEFRIIRGKPRYFRSSAVAERGFCKDCGTYLIYRPLIAQWSNWMIITIACLDHPEELSPRRHYGSESRIPWFDPQGEPPHEKYEDNFIDILSDGSPDERKAILERFGAP